MRIIRAGEYAGRRAGSIALEYLKRTDAGAGAEKIADLAAAAFRAAACAGAVTLSGQSEHEAYDTVRSAVLRAAGGSAPGGSFTYSAPSLSAASDRILERSGGFRSSDSRDILRLYGVLDSIDWNDGFSIREGLKAAENIAFATLSDRSVFRLADSAGDALEVLCGLAERLDRLYPPGNGAVSWAGLSPEEIRRLMPADGEAAREFGELLVARERFESAAAGFSGVPEAYALLMHLDGSASLDAYRKDLTEEIIRRYREHGGSSRRVDGHLTGRILTGEIDVGKVAESGQLFGTEADGDILTLLRTLEALSDADRITEESHRDILIRLGVRNPAPGKLDMNSMKSVNGRIYCLSRALENAGFLPCAGDGLTWSGMSSSRLKVWLDRNRYTVPREQLDAVREILILRSHTETLSLMERIRAGVLREVRGIARRTLAEGTGDSDFGRGYMAAERLRPLAEAALDTAMRTFRFTASSAAEAGKGLYELAPAPVKEAMDRNFRLLKRRTAAVREGLRRRSAEFRERIGKKSPRTDAPGNGAPDTEGAVRKKASELRDRRSAAKAERTAVKAAGKAFSLVSRTGAALNAAGLMLRKTTAVLTVCLVCVFLLTDLAGAFLPLLEGAIDYTVNLNGILFGWMEEWTWPFGPAGGDRQNVFFATVEGLGGALKDAEDLKKLLEDRPGLEYRSFIDPADGFVCAVFPRPEDIREADRIYYYYEDRDGNITHTPVTPYDMIRRVIAAAHAVSTPVGTKEETVLFQEYAYGLLRYMVSSDLGARVEVCEKGDGEYTYRCDDGSDGIYGVGYRTVKPGDSVIFLSGLEKDSGMFSGEDGDTGFVAVINDVIRPFDRDGCAVRYCAGDGTSDVYDRGSGEFLRTETGGETVRLSSLSVPGDTGPLTVYGPRQDIRYAADPVLDKRCLPELEGVLSGDVHALEEFVRALSFCSDPSRCPDRKTVSYTVETTEYHDTSDGPCVCPGCVTRYLSVCGGHTVTGPDGGQHLVFCSRSGLDGCSNVVSYPYYECPGHTVPVSRTAEVCPGHYHCSGHRFCDGHTVRYCTGHLVYTVKEWLSAPGDESFRNAVWEYPAEEVPWICEPSADVIRSGDIEKAFGFTGWDSGYLELEDHVYCQDWYEKYGYSAMTAEGGRITESEAADIRDKYGFTDGDPMADFALECVGTVPTCYGMKAKKPGADPDFGTLTDERISGFNGISYGLSGIGGLYFADYVYWSVYGNRDPVLENAETRYEAHILPADDLRTGDILIRTVTVPDSEGRPVTVPAETAVVIGKNGSGTWCAVHMGDHWAELTTVDTGGMAQWYRLSF